MVRPIFFSIMALICGTLCADFHENTLSLMLLEANDPNKALEQLPAEKMSACAHIVLLSGAREGLHRMSEQLEREFAHVRLVDIEDLGEVLIASMYPIERYITSDERLAELIVAYKDYIVNFHFDSEGSVHVFNNGMPTHANQYVVDNEAYKVHLIDVSDEILLAETKGKLYGEVEVDTDGNKEARGGYEHSQTNEENGTEMKGYVEGKGQQDAEGNVSGNIRAGGTYVF